MEAPPPAAAAAGVAATTFMQKQGLMKKVSFHTQDNRGRQWQLLKKHGHKEKRMLHCVPPKSIHRMGIGSLCVCMNHAALSSQTHILYTYTPSTIIYINGTEWNGMKWNRWSWLDANHLKSHPPLLCTVLCFVLLIQCLSLN